MSRRFQRIAIVVLTVTATSACGVGAASPTPPSSTALPPATSFEEYAESFCAAFDALFLAIGNPDTGARSELHMALDDAVAALDAEAAERLATEITGTLEAGRQDVARAGGWLPGAPIMDQLDRVFVAFEAYIAAKSAAAMGDPGAGDPQTALEEAGGIDAWFAMFSLYPALEAERPATTQQCANVPVSP